MNIKTIIEIHEDTKDKDGHKKSWERYYKYIIRDLTEECKRLNIPIDNIVGTFKYKTHYNWSKEWLSEDHYFTAWSEQYVFVRGIYDGGRWIVAVPRNPTDDVVEPIGGG